MGVSKARGGMGFWDLACFNNALLAKQIWHLWKTPENLVARIMKAKYYPDCSVLDAFLGKEPSFAWRSIQGSNDLVKEGLIWRVGNGKTTRIWKDRWIPLPTTFMVCSPPSLLDPNETVSRLIDADTKWWDYAMLEKLFTREVIMKIQSVPLSTTNQEDALIWRGTTNRLFRYEAHIICKRIVSWPSKREGSIRSKESNI